jgi:hypothetical protein
MIIYVFKNKLKVKKQELLVDLKTEIPKHKILYWDKNSKKVSKRRTCLEIQENKKPIKYFV